MTKHCEIVILDNKQRKVPVLRIEGEGDFEITGYEWTSTYFENRITHEIENFDGSKARIMCKGSLGYEIFYYKPYAMGSYRSKRFLTLTFLPNKYKGIAAKMRHMHFVIFDGKNDDAINAAIVAYKLGGVTCK